MAKIDTSKIEGYADMTPEQKIAALEGLEIDDGAEEIDRLKNAVSKSNSEAAERKKKQSEQETELTQLRSKVEEMEKREKVADHKARFLAMGYDEALAQATAQAMVDGDTDKVFANQKKFLADHDKTLKAEMLKGTPKPDGAPGGSEGMTLEKLRKMSPAERYDYAAKNPEEYKNLYDGGN